MSSVLGTVAPKETKSLTKEENLAADGLELGETGSREARGY